MEKELLLISRKYGNDMAILCNNLFYILLKKEGLLNQLLNIYFPNSISLYDDIVSNNLEEEFKNYIYSLVDVEKMKLVEIKNPFDLMKNAGYTLYKCESEDDIQIFKKYYEKNEQLCTFRGGRLDTCYVFFAIKNNINEIKRNNIPNREDEYGTSVISIQFTKGKYNTVSIKNRYNHRVPNPDATFSNNLDNIIAGLTLSFENEYNYNITNQEKLHIPGYINIKGIYYKYNYKINGIYYCPNNIIIKDGKVIKEYLDTSRYFILDYYIIDLETNKIKVFDQSIENNLHTYLSNIKKLIIINDEKENVKCIVVDKKRKIVCDLDNTILFLEINKRLYLRNDIGLRRRFKDKSNKKRVLK